MRAMELLIKDRAETLAGLYVAITRRCPLECAHCSTCSHPKTPEIDNKEFLLTFFETILNSKNTKPRHIFFTGGEALLHADLVLNLAQKAKAFNAFTHLISGGFFFRAKKIPHNIIKTLSKIDNIIISWDIFHEKFVSFQDLMKGIQSLLELGLEVSIQYTLADKKDDEYLYLINKKFPDISIFKDYLAPVGRAKNLFNKSINYIEADTPCISASWPVISYYGQIITCCNQEIIDSKLEHIPHHLLLGTLFSNTWDDIIHTRFNSRFIKIIETLGPASLYNSSNKINKLSQCESCLLACSRSNPHIYQIDEPSKALYENVRIIREEVIKNHLHKNEG